LSFECEKGVTKVVLQSTSVFAQWPDISEFFGCFGSKGLSQSGNSEQHTHEYYAICGTSSNKSKSTSNDKSQVNFYNDSVPEMDQKFRLHMKYKLLYCTVVYNFYSFAYVHKIFIFNFNCGSENLYICATGSE
jgi:hypothetical protein